ncbi:MAG: THUMP domain-containing protein [Thermoplasmata archaeon]
MVAILLRYGEIGIKSKRVRSRFENILIKNIEDVFLINNLDCIIERQWGRIFVYTGDAGKGINLLKRVLGIVSVSEAIETTSKIEDICKTAAEFSKVLIKKGQSFAIRCRRTGTHKYTSQEAAKETGDAVYLANEHKKISVDLTNPDVEIFVEIRNNKAYLFSEKVQCAGGMPVGSQGKVIAEISDMNSVIAMWLLMKRGCKSIPVFFNYNKNKGKVLKLIDILTLWDISVKLHIASDENILSEAKSNKYSALEKIGKSLNAEAILSPATMKDIADIKPTGLPIFYPLIGFDDKEIAEIGRRIIAVVE